MRAAVHLEPWGPGHLPLLELLNDPEMTKHVGGPETPEQVADRQSRYEPADSRQYRIVVEPESDSAGWVGYWEIPWDGEQVWDTGWAVLPSFQGRGVASSATAQLIELARAERLHRYMHAYPRVENSPSNAICRSLGFTLLGEVDFAARGGGTARCNDWRLDLEG